MDFVKLYKELSEKFRNKKTPSKKEEKKVVNNEDDNEIIDISFNGEDEALLNENNLETDVVDNVAENIDEFTFDNNNKKKSLKERIESINIDSAFFKTHKKKIIGGSVLLISLLGVIIAKPYLMEFYKNYNQTNSTLKAPTSTKPVVQPAKQPIQQQINTQQAQLDEKKTDEDLLKQFKNNAPEQKNSDEDLLKQFKNSPEQNSTPSVNKEQNSNNSNKDLKDSFNGVSASLESLKKSQVDKTTDELDIKTNPSNTTKQLPIVNNQPKEVRQVDVINNSLKQEAKNLLKNEERETSLEGAMIKEDLKNNKHIENSLGLMNKGRDMGNIDAYTLVSEDFTKLEEYEKLIDKRQVFMAKMSAYLKQRQEYIDTLKAFENITSVNSQETQNKKIKEQVLSETNEVIAALNNQINGLNSKITSMEKEQIMKTKVKEPEVNPEEAKKRQEAKSHEEEGLLLKRELEENLKNINIFKMNNNLIIVVNSEDQDMIYKEGDFFGSGFRIKEITESVISFEKDGRVYYHTIANALKQKAFTKVTVKLPGQVKEDLNYDEKDVKKGSSDEVSSVKEYQTSEDKKKAYADKLLNSKTTTKK